MGKIIEVQAIESDEQQNQGQDQNDIPSMDELKKMIELKNNENMKRFGEELQALMNKYSIDIVPRVTIEGNRVIESAVLAVNR